MFRVKDKTNILVEATRDLETARQIVEEGRQMLEDIQRDLRAIGCETPVAPPKKPD